ncbi:MAG: T9SS type A sorting domain-containing protein [Bacteroidetes bacterium]|nr:T9SS type A sorting domain-containing protein [Bacteroidota bacterium]
MITGNAIGNNSGIGIDLDGGTEDGDFRTANDAGDGDEGPNNLQNTPEIVSADVDASNNVTITYYVDSDTSLSTSGASAYPLQINFYEADADQEEGFGILTQETYTSSDYSGCGAPPCPKTTTFQSLVSVSESDYVNATATDADGNTSEFSAPSNQLPVELAAFTARLDGERVVLQWSTLSETGNDGFSIERSIDDAPFAAAGYRSGAGTTTQRTDYRLVDAAIPVGGASAEYRLRQIDVDGDARVVGRVEVRLTSGSSFTLGRPTPNPAADVATVDVSVPADMDDVSLVLFDLLGRRVRSVEANALGGSSAVNVRVDDLAAGTYLLRLTGNGRVQTQKLTVVR